ncbi:hypothetical protein N2152v2_010153 [Parachlorella kessleri]
MRAASDPQGEVELGLANVSTRPDVDQEPATAPLGLLTLLPTDLLHCVLQQLTPRELCSELDAHWGRLFAQLFPRLLLTFERTPPAWWASGAASWRHRFAALCGGAPFQAQVYNREQDNDQEDFLLSCYDATVQLARSAVAQLGSGAGEPTFVASYMAMGKMPAVQEQGITQWRLRPAPAQCHPLEVYGGDGQAVSQGDHVEVQWKGRKGHPFGWWFGRVHAVQGGTVTLEFVQYPRSSAWRWVDAPLLPGGETVVNGDPTFGYIGGLRRLSAGEAADWWQHCPPQRVWDGREEEALREWQEGPAAPVGQPAGIAVGHPLLGAGGGVLLAAAELHAALEAALAAAVAAGMAVGLGEGIAQGAPVAGVNPGAAPGIGEAAAAGGGAAQPTGAAAAANAAGAAAEGPAEAAAVAGPQQPMEAAAALLQPAAAGAAAGMASPRDLVSPRGVVQPPTSGGTAAAVSLASPGVLQPEMLVTSSPRLLMRPASGGAAAVSPLKTSPRTNLVTRLVAHAGPLRQ